MRSHVCKFLYLSIVQNSLLDLKVIIHLHPIMPELQREGLNGMNLSKKKFDFKSTYEYILGLDEKIRFVGIINDLGRLVYGGMRPGVISLENETESVKMYMEFALISKLHTDFDSKLGEVLYSMTVRKKIKMLSFPVLDHLIRLSLETDADHERIIANILAYLKKIQE